MPILSWALGSLVGRESTAQSNATSQPRPSLDQTASTLASPLPSPSVPSSPPSPIPQSIGAHARVIGVDPAQEEPLPRSPFFSARSLKQAGLFFAGAGFLTLSVMVSRRAAIRHHTQSRLKYYHPNYRSTKTVDAEVQKDPLIAFQALNLATLNVLSFAIMATGGVAWAMDLSSLEDLRTKARRSLYGPGGGTDEDAEREIADWMAKVMGKKDEPTNQTNKNGAESSSK